ncbi:MAG: ABC transporter ATP-binding protein, partial [Acidimicrobiia bacterium]
STLIALVAGLAIPESGRILIDGVQVKGPGRDRGVVFQDLALMPWRTVSRNIGHGMEIARASREEIRKAVDKYVKMVGLDGFEKYYPHQLSGGMKQRVAVARTLAADPDVVLMDEPFAAVDAQTRITLGQELLSIARLTGKTIIFVTHSVDEAVFIGDQVLVMSQRPGRVKHLFEVPIARAERHWDSIVSDPRFLGPRDQVMRSVREELVPQGQERS